MIQLHGALLDAEILADVYLMMTGGQTDLALAVEEQQEQQEVVIDISDIDLSTTELAVIRASADELKAHDQMLDLLDKKSENGAIWRRV